MKTAIVHDWLTNHAGSEKVVEGLLHLVPDAPIYTLVHQPENFRGTAFHGRDIRTSFVQRLPRGAQKYQTYLPLMPLAVEQFDLSEYDLILSSSHAVAKGVRVGAGQLHVSYVHTPIRYAWDLQDQYLREAGLDRGVKGAAARVALHYLRLWDTVSANRVDVFLANSHYVARRIWRAYRRRAHVLYPPVDVARFDPTRRREDFYLTMSRLVPYKKIDLIVRTFGRLDRPLVVIGDGPERGRLEALAGPNVTFLGRQEDPVAADLMSRCKAFVFAADEDFGITPVEAQAAGAPVIAYGHGGSLETVQANRTGLHFYEQTEDSLLQAVQAFEARAPFDPAVLRAHAETFRPEHFHVELLAIIAAARQAFRAGHDPEEAVMRLGETPR
ncbi:glycosyltransferase [Deinococcus peraridilitoris]|uniref:Glycosyltransferase n=1 Tax=Deinococcus peraridilitoris (strain DSM 19664 / LMG 22246 / CIP 109416 / KR-200) TaxID=937777 RepID=K9ZXW3_DEIPD|nr:glycosyltransferase [Deinococcus peraridilitoris]AFZ66503.1 glycosyltransferase [Deinococcus peraridilitoris DSM 19664]